MAKNMFAGWRNLVYGRYSELDLFLLALLFLYGNMRHWLELTNWFFPQGFAGLLTFAYFINFIDFIVYLAAGGYFIVFSTYWAFSPRSPEPRKSGVAIYLGILFSALLAVMAARELVMQRVVQNYSFLEFIFALPFIIVAWVRLLLILPPKHGDLRVFWRRVNAPGQFNEGNIPHKAIIFSVLVLITAYYALNVFGMYSTNEATRYLITYSIASTVGNWFKEKPVEIPGDY